MKKTLCALALGLWAAGAPSALYAADDLRGESVLTCSGGIVEAGETKFATQEKCGPPASKDERGDLWIYNFGPGRFVYFVTFLEGTVVRIQSGGYGN